MPKYKYVLTQDSGIRKEGEIISPNIAAAKKKLSKKKGILISVIEERETTEYFWQKASLSMQDKVLFTRHMSTMIKVGVTVTEALQILMNQTKQKNNHRMYKNILEMIETGQSLSKALRAYDYVFSELFINMIATAEKSGTLAKVFEYLAVQMEKDYEIRKKVTSAFIYPAIIIALTMTVAAGIVIFIMPRITKIFSTFDIELPTITKILINTSTFITEKPLITLLIAAGVVGFFILIFKTKYLKPFWGRVFLRVPVFGKILINANLARFNRTLSSLLQSGVGVTESMDILRKMLTNPVYKDFLKEVRDKVEQGGKLGVSLGENEKLFPQLVSKTISIGEKTGSLEMTTHQLANLYENNVDAITRNLSVLLEPILLFFMATLVGSIVLAIILPIYQLPSMIQR